MLYNRFFNKKTDPLTFAKNQTNFITLLKDVSQQTLTIQFKLHIQFKQ